MSSRRARRAQLVEQLTRQVRQMGGATVLFHQTIADRIGVHPTDMQCMNILDTTGPVTAGRLAELTGLTTGAVTRLVDRLERAGYVRRRRDTEDRRQVFVELVPERMAGVAPLYASMGAAWEAQLRRFSDEELELILDFAAGAAEMTRGEIAKVRALAEPHADMV